MRVVFFGTPLFAVPTLEALAAEEDLAPLLVVSQPSKPTGRGHKKIEPPPVAQTATRLGLDLAQPASVRDPEFLDRLRALAPDVAVVVAFGQIFRKTLLELPRLGCVNLHGSLLPKYRGAAPIQAAIAAGDQVTGLTTMRMTRGLDAGPMLAKVDVPIAPDDTTVDLAPRLAAAGAPLMVETLRGLAAGTVRPEEQDDELATYAPKIEKHDGEVDWSLPARRIFDLWRAYQPWPGLVTHLCDGPVKLLRVALPERPVGEGIRWDLVDGETPPGTLLAVGDGRLLVACGGDTLLAVERLQRPGKQPVTGTDFANGERLQIGERFSAGCSPGPR